MSSAGSAPAHPTVHQPNFALQEALFGQGYGFLYEILARFGLFILLAPAKRMPDVQRATQCTPGVCRIGQQSFDGFGHQMESKLTCIAAALALSLEFVHLPFVGKAHGEDPREMERFMDLGRLFRPLARPMRKVKRYPSSWSTWPFATPCRFCMKLNSANLSLAT